VAPAAGEGGLMAWSALFIGLIVGFLLDYLFHAVTGK
jgi:hypothetical protein